jgi:hypothetical protein
LTFSAARSVIMIMLLAASWGAGNLLPYYSYRSEALGT